jgi:hypothetical protein
MWEEDRQRAEKFHLTDSPLANEDGLRAISGEDNGGESLLRKIFQQEQL